MKASHYLITNRKYYSKKEHNWECFVVLFVVLSPLWPGVIKYSNPIQKKIRTHKYFVLRWEPAI